MQSSNISEKRETTTKSLGEPTRGLSVRDGLPLQFDLKQKSNVVEGLLMQHALCRSTSMKCFSNMVDNRILSNFTAIIKLAKALND